MKPEHPRTEFIDYYFTPQHSLCVRNRRRRRERIAECKRELPFSPSLSLPHSFTFRGTFTVCVHYTKNCYLFLRSARHVKRNPPLHNVPPPSNKQFPLFFCSTIASARARILARNAVCDIKKLRERGFLAITCNNAALRIHSVGHRVQPLKHGNVMLVNAAMQLQCVCVCICETYLFSRIMHARPVP